MPPKKAAAKTASKTAMMRMSINVPKPLLSKVDAVAAEIGMSRAELIKSVLISSLSAYSPKLPHICPRGHRRPCDLPPDPDPA